MDVVLEWQGAERFAARTAAGQGLMVDGAREAGASPVETLEIALAACMGIDVVDILTKGRQTVSGCSVRVVAKRAETPPRRLTDVTLSFALRGPDLSRAKVERAVELSRATYCSVWHSLAPDIGLVIEIEIA